MEGEEKHLFIQCSSGIFNILHLITDFSVHFCITTASNREHNMGMGILTSVVYYDCCSLYTICENGIEV